MRFAGFPPEGIEFYERLEVENTKDFWQAHKHVWESAIRDPMDALMEELREEFGDAKVFRPYRDVRFSKDKSPYKTFQGGFAATAGGMGYYTQISADGLLTAAGFYEHSPDQVERYRAAVLDETTGAELTAMTRALVKKGFELGGDVMKTRPRGVDPEHTRIDLLRHRSLTPWRTLQPGATLHSRKALTRVRDDWRALRPLNEWVETYVGASREERRR